jgi:hypothetical protein
MNDCELSATVAAVTDGAQLAASRRKRLRDLIIWHDPRKFLIRILLRFSV